METTPYKTEDYLDNAQITEGYLKEILDLEDAASRPCHAHRDLAYDLSVLRSKVSMHAKAFSSVLIALNRRIAKLEGVELDD